MSFTKTQNKFSKGIDDKADGTAVTINEAGNVGIGTDDPQSDLHVDGEVLVKTDDGASATINVESSSPQAAVNLKSPFGGYKITTESSDQGEAFRFAILDRTDGFKHRLVIDSGGNVGIGMNDPQRKFHSKATQQVGAVLETTGNRSYLGFLDVNRDDQGGQYGPIVGSQGNDFIIATGPANTERVRVNANGKVGLGLTDADEVLEVRGDIKTNTGGGAGVLHFGETSDECKITGRDSSHVSKANVMDFFTDGTQRMRLTDNGDLCIGDNAEPDSKLDVRGIILGGAGAPSSGQIAFGIQYGGSTNITTSWGSAKSSAAGVFGWGCYGSNSNTNQFVSSVDKSLDFRRSAFVMNQNKFEWWNGPQQTVDRDASVTMTMRMELDESGHLLIGKTSASASLVGHYLLSGGKANHTTSDEEPLILNRTNTTGGQKTMVSFLINSGNSGAITTAGAGTPQFASTSDIRLKNNVTDHNSELSNVMALRPVRWAWKDEDKGEGEGFIAQELEETPWADLVFEGDDGYKQVAGLGLVETRLIKALQEAVTRIETLEAEVATLKGAN